MTKGAWSSPAVDQHGIRSLPSLKLFRGDQLIVDGHRKVLAKLNSL